jgi:predicted PurR-regulated permease PerM
VSAIRNVIEPKIVGESVGVHPVLMLISLFIGAKIFGPLGIIILPFTLIVISKLNATERIKLYKVVPKEAPAKKEKRGRKKKA